MKNKLMSMLSVLALSITMSFPTYASKDVQTIEINEVTATVEQLAEGITVVIKLNEDGGYDQQVYYEDIEDIELPRQTRATADGILEWAVFHLGFKDWNQDTGDLYFTISSDEAMSSVTGSAYVKSTSILFPKSYYSDSFTEKLYSSYNTSRDVALDVDTGSETKVKVGFTSVVMTTIAGDKASFGSASQTVDRP